jgi:putative SOS response-associated peptidase YedK
VFALNDDRPLFAFAGIWTTFNGDRGTKTKPIPGPHQVYGFLTTSPNAVVEPIHPKAMPVILTHRRGTRHLDACALGRGEGVAATIAG